MKKAIEDLKWKYSLCEFRCITVIIGLFLIWLGARQIQSQQVFVKGELFFEGSSAVAFGTGWALLGVLLLIRVVRVIRKEKREKLDS